MADGLECEFRLHSGLSVKDSWSLFFFHKKERRWRLLFLK
jgi:hypothetical protein